MHPFPIRTPVSPSAMTVITRLAYHNDFAPGLCGGGLHGNVSPCHCPSQLELAYPGVTGNHSVRHTRSGGHYLSAKADAYTWLVKDAISSRKAPPGQICVDWLFAPPDARGRDVDNLMKVVKDALTKCGFWADDSNKVMERLVVWPR